MSVNKMKNPLKGLLGVALFLGAGNALADWEVNLPKPVTPIGQDIFHLHMLIFWVCVAIGVVVFGVMFYSLFKFRKSRGVVASQFHESTAVEVVWTIVPALILIGMAIPASKTLIAMEDTRHADMTVKITGHQWWWDYDYLGQGVNVASHLSTPQDEIYDNAPKDKHYLREVDHPLVVPVGKKIRFLITSNDVIHSWWVPRLGVKKDAIPGFINQSWTEIEKPGVYRGQCSELCGVGHAFMPIVVVAKTGPEFQQWLAQQKAKQATVAAESGKTFTKDALIAKGKKVFDTNCAVCHQVTGLGIPGTFPPLAGGHPFSASPQMIADLTKLGFYKDGKIVMGPVKHHVEIVLHGITGTPMPAFGPQLSDVDIAAVITYERNDFGNHTGDVIQPAEVQAARAGK